jgi:hypothetical protein
VPLSRVSRPPFIAGIEQDYPQLGAAAVDPVIGMLHRNELGPPPKPLTLLPDGTGIPGPPAPAAHRAGTGCAFASAQTRSSTGLRIAVKAT